LREVEQALADHAPGKIRARCQQDYCVVEFDRVGPEKHKKIAEAVEKLGFKIVGAAIASTGSRRYAADIRFRVVPRKRSMRKAV
jgi:PP-loop superfamily ATP-utilizing enzyme